mgnify:CR=1 FL=1
MDPLVEVLRSMEGKVAPALVGPLAGGECCRPGMGLGIAARSDRGPLCLGVFLDQEMRPSGTHHVFSRIALASHWRPVAVVPWRVS